MCSARREEETAKLAPSTRMNDKPKRAEQGRIQTGATIAGAARPDMDEKDDFISKEAPLKSKT